MNDDRDGDSGQVPQLANCNAEPAELDIFREHVRLED